MWSGVGALKVLQITLHSLANDFGTTAVQDTRCRVERFDEGVGYTSGYLGHAGLSEYSCWDQGNVDDITLDRGRRQPGSCLGIDDDRR